MNTNRFARMIVFWLALFLIPIVALKLTSVSRKPVPKSVAKTAPASPVTPASTAPKACDLVKSEDISKLTGVPFKAGVVTNDYAGDTQCRYDQANGKQQVMMTVHGIGKIDVYQHVPGSVNVAGLGDGAVWNEGNAQLAVAHGESVFSIAFMPPPGKKSHAIALARVALSRL